MVIRPCVIVVVTALATVAGAETPGRAEFERGRALYAAGDFEAARVALLAAYEASGGRPSTILAVARCEDALHRPVAALAWYRRYLATDPPEAVRHEVELRVHELQVSLPTRPPPVVPPPPRPPDSFDLAGRRRPAAPPPVAPPSVAVEPPVSSDGLLSNPWFWTAVGAVVVAGAVTAGVLLTGPDAPDPLGGSTGRVLQR